MIFVALFFLVFAILLIFFAFFLSLAFLFGPPFVATPKKVVDEIISLAKVNKNDNVFDLGSGDGRILLESAKICKRAEGFEINPFLVLWTKLMAIRFGINSEVSIHWQNYQKGNFSNATIVFLYNLPLFIPSVEKKLKKELKPGSRIVSYKFPLSKFKLVSKTKSGIYLYKVAK